jgi:cytochrome b subunit of formate dehydrogenase
MKRYYNPFILLILSFLVFSSTLIAQSDECLTCHADEGLTYERDGRTVSLYVNQDKFSSSAHGFLSCADCHTGYDPYDIPHKEGKNIYEVDCSMCHSDITENAEFDIHNRLAGKGAENTPDCVDCHGDHQIQPSDAYANKKQHYCSDCHDNVQLTKTYHKTEFYSDQSCADCHEQTPDFQAEMEKSVHADFACVDCHTYVNENFDDHPANPEASAKASCATCHLESDTEHKESIHGISLEQGVEEAAQCSDCHGSHDIIPVDKEESPVHPQNLSKTCGTCHEDPELTEKHMITAREPVQKYNQSVHGKLIQEGNMAAATCSDCHGVHDIKNKLQPGSKIATLNIPNSCGECHPEAEEKYKKSIHWIYAQKGVEESPVCNDCHVEHSMQAITTEEQRMEVRKLQQETCIRCHQDPVLAERFGFDSENVSQYMDSYHGLAVIRGDEDAAMCVDCHKVHEILPKEHPQSSINDENVTATCQECHPNATTVFSQSYTHKAGTETAEKVENIVSSLYFWLIVAVIGGMVLHNLLILFVELKKRKKQLNDVVTVPRFTKNEVIQHIILFVSFIVLAITGFALKYPTSWWAEGLLEMGMTETVRQNIHRVSAVVMMALGIYHIVYLLVTRRGRDVLSHLLPRISDVKEAWYSILYYLKIVKKKPYSDKYDYTEKAEYWALIWGTIVMGITGLILWFPTIVGEWAPIWLIRVSEIIHFYEAILASLAIIVWHWFFVIFHPSEYPMSFVWIDGHMSLHHYRHHHELHFRKIAKDYLEVKYGKKDEKEMKHSTELFMNTLKENGADPDKVIENEIRNDLELRQWLENEIGTLEEEETDSDK